MADRNPALAIAFLFLVLMPQMAVSLTKHPGAAIRLPPWAWKLIQKGAKKLISHIIDEFFSSGNQSTSGGGRQAPATTAGVYIYSFQVGTPPQNVSGMLDINSELVWTQCACPDCGPTTGAGLFNPSVSSTMRGVPCANTTCQQVAPQTCPRADVPANCSYNSTGTGGYLTEEEFRFGDSQPAVSLVFGCALYSKGRPYDLGGVIGLGRGPLSLVSQLQEGRFSYYFAPDYSDSESFIYFGGDAKPQTTKSSQLSTTRLLNSSAFPNSYYVGLSGIRVDGKDLAIARETFDINATDGSGGVILSLTIPVTFLDQVAYRALKEELVRKINLTTVDGSSLGLDLCYTNQSLAMMATIPAMALVFDGGRAVMKLETWNYFYTDASTALKCLSILPSPAGSLSLLGNLIQVGTHMIYDVSGSMLTFESLAATPSNSSPHKSSSAPSLRTSPVVAIDFVYWVMVYMLYWVVAF